ncbi:Uncharacterised protein [Mycobacteroides abscessus subsp. abscessus]|nr:Uncharacterised protein [Mycobacteroides abscessus subsp. abscessus]
MSSVIRTPCPRRSQPQKASASWIDGSPKASPAWMVKCALLARMYSKASRCRVGGYPASAPAMSKPPTPRSRQRTASSAISRERAACRMAVSRQVTTIGWPAAAAARSPSRKPARVCSTTSSRLSPRSRCCSGA